LGRCRPERITKHYFSFIGHFGLKKLGITINVLKEKEKNTYKEMPLWLKSYKSDWLTVQQLFQF